MEAVDKTMKARWDARRNRPIKVTEGTKTFAYFRRISLQDGFNEMMRKGDKFTIAIATNLSKLI